MSTRLLTPLPVSPSHPEDILPNLELAIAGRETYLPVPAEDIHRAELLRTSQRAGEPISEDIALVVATSGSTGTPKGAMQPSEFSRCHPQGSRRRGAVALGTSTTSHRRHSSTGALRGGGL